MRLLAKTSGVTNCYDIHQYSEHCVYALGQFTLLKDMPNAQSPQDASQARTVNTYILREFLDMKTFGMLRHHI